MLYFSKQFKMIFDLPFQEEVRLCPEALGKLFGEEGINVVDVYYLGNGNCWEENFQGTSTPASVTITTSK